MHVKKDDLVVVIAGSDADPVKARRVLRVVTKTNKVVVEGVNRVFKHVRARADRRNPQGGRLSKEMPISVSNVMLFCAKCGFGVRVARKTDASGVKERICKKCGMSLGVIRQAKKKQTATPATVGTQGS